jgi:hypothetical protein
MSCSFGFWCSRLAAVALAVAMLVGVAAPAPAQDDAGTPPSLDGQADASQPCADGRLRIRDLQHADPSIPSGLEHVYEVGEAWEEDAQLFALRLVCPLLETGYQWEGTFFSRDAQAFFATDTGQSTPAEDDPAKVTILSTDGLQVQFVYLSLVRAGFDPDSPLSAGSGVTVRINTDAQPFGPPAAPKDDVYFHVAIEERGEVIDVWVASKDGTVYSYNTVSNESGGHLH